MRDELAKRYGEWHCFTARFDTYGKTEGDANVALIYDVRIDGQPVADHLWIHRSKHMKRLNLMHGDTLQFEARVGRYAALVPRPHITPTTYKYNVEKIREMRVVKRLERNGQREN